MVDKWLDFIFSNKTWLFDQDTVLIGHSAGATLILRILERLPNECSVSKAILVSGVVELGDKVETFPYKRSLVKDPFNWEKIKDSAKAFYFVHSDNDPYQCGIDQGKIMQRQLGGRLILKSGEGHFNLERSPEYKKFPFLLELL